MVVLAFVLGLFVGAGFALWAVGLYLRAGNRVGPEYVVRDGVMQVPKDKTPQYTDWQGMNKFSLDEVQQVKPCCAPSTGCEFCDAVRRGDYELGSPAGSR